MPTLFKFPLRSKEGSSKTTKDEEMEESLHESLHVNEEYKEAFKSKSYLDLFSKFQSLLHKRPSSRFTSSPMTKSTSSSRSLSSLSSTSFSVNSKINLRSCFLDPKQELLLQSVKSSKIKALLEDYFNITREAYNVCELLLDGIQKTRSNNNFLKQQVQLLLSSDQGRDNNEMLIRELASFASLSNPLSNIVDFRKIHEGHSTLLNKLRPELRRMKRKQKIVKLCKKFAGIALRNIDCNWLKPSVREQLVSRLDVTARGSYILMNDFDTIAMLAVRVHDEVEHRKAMTELCVRNGDCEQVVKETIKELFKYENKFSQKLDELEEHVYLCFVTIKRFRKQVYAETSSG